MWPGLRHVDPVAVDGLKGHDGIEPQTRRRRQADHDDSLQENGCLMGLEWDFVDGILWNSKGFNGIYPPVTEHNHGKWP